MPRRGLPLAPVNGYTFNGALEYHRYNELSDTDKTAYIQFATLHTTNSGDTGTQGLGVWNAWLASPGAARAPVPRGGRARARGGVRGGVRGRGARGATRGRSGRGGRGGAGGSSRREGVVRGDPGQEDRDGDRDGDAPAAPEAPANPPPDPTVYGWLREEFEEWKLLHPFDRLAYVRWANEQKSDGTRTRQQGKTIIEEWKDLDTAAREEILERYQTRDWPLYKITDLLETDFDIVDTAESDVRTMSISESSEDSFNLPDTIRDETVADLKDTFPEENHDWRLVETLYRAPPEEIEGGYMEEGCSCISCLFVSFDEGNTAHKRVVVKYAEWEASERGRLYRDEYLERHRMVCNLPDNDYILKPWALKPQRRILGSISKVGPRIFMDYCPSKTLREVLGAYIGTGRQIPEPFIWLVFLNIAESLYLFHKGRLYDQTPTEQSDDWTAILHRDLKPGNIFLNVGQHPYPFYPFPQLADFDMCVRVGEEDWNLRRLGTPNWQAPEMMHDENKDRTSKPDLSAKSDIFVLGLLVWELTHAFADGATLDDEQKKTEETTKEASGAARDIDPDRDGVYSYNLVWLQQQCLDNDPDNRPTAQKLVGDIRKYMKKWEKAHGLYDTKELKISGGKAEESLDVDGRWKLEFP
ncbi:kinase-like protein [Lophiostoma macrostomum CBS 122681]|uniref:non-specific serine/threonine protein kinase n=1 Tax=Lophiostoma macrostomum CBS 122681 TaxID=1314788 RepID=A0A6A6SMS4_9PLEO|nr:kinase-like protein [Lophiostoma macrostomum CBS 122681]